MSCLSDADRKTLLDLASQAIVEAVCHGSLLQSIPQCAVLEQRCGVFVTLHVKGKLRGCIGVIDGRERLGEGIVRCAVSAAQDDPRFAHMKPDEIEDVEIEISLL